MSTIDVGAAHGGVVVVMSWPISQWVNDNRDRRKHWAATAKRAANIREAARKLGDVAKQEHGHVASPLDVKFTIGFPDLRERDLENWSSKPFLDGLVDSGLIAGDSNRHITHTHREESPIKSPKGEITFAATIRTVEQ